MPNVLGEVLRGRETPAEGKHTEAPFHPSMRHPLLAETSCRTLAFSKLFVSFAETPAGREEVLPNSKCYAEGPSFQGDLL